MKKLVTVALMVLVATFCVCAELTAILSVKPYYTGNNIPSVGFKPDGSGNWTYDEVSDPSKLNNLDNDWWMKRQDYWMLGYDKTSVLDFGMEIHNNGFNFVTRLDIMQDVFPNQTNPSSLSTNIPFVGNLIDLSFPRLGYMDWTSENGNFFVSVGRRLIKWGPGTYDLTIADSQPYLDNIWFEYRLPMKNDWNFNYNYVIVSPKYWMNYGKTPVQKTIFAHKWSFNNNNFRVTLAELNNIYGKDPNFLDASPLIIWHDSNQDGNSNVFMHLVLEAKVGPVRVFGGFAMDDFDLPHEKPAPGAHSDKPQAMGFSGGIELHLLDGKDNGNAKFDRRDYTLKEESFKIESGLNIGAEFYYVSPLMYNRNTTGAPDGKFTIPFQYISLTGTQYIYERDAYYLGFKYGPNSQLLRFYAEYTQKPFEAYVSAELLTRGTYGIESWYGDSDKWNAMGLADNELLLCGDLTKALLLEANFAYYLDEAFKVEAGFNWQKDFTHDKSAYKVTVGMSINPVDVDWNNLF